jgi:hypothetical protein
VKESGRAIVKDAREQNADDGLRCAAALIGAMIDIVTGRGIYHLSAAAPLEFTHDSIVLMLAMQRADGIERVVTKCRIAKELVNEHLVAEAIIERLKGWLSGNFENTREVALKAIRSERRLHEIRFDLANRGPF